MNYLRELLGGVDDLAGAVEVGVAHAVWVVVTAVGVAVTSEAVLGVGTAAVWSSADVEIVVLTSVGGQSEGVRVGLPDIDLSTAGTALSDTSVLITLRRLPALKVGL